MSSNSFVATVDLNLRPSMRALKILFLLHGIPIAALPFAMQPGPPMAIICGLVLLSWLWLRRHPVFGFGPRALTRLVWHADGRWSVHDAAGRGGDAKLLGNSYVHPRLMLLRFRLMDGSVHSRALIGDEADGEALRRLRARLVVPAAKDA